MSHNSELQALTHFALGLTAAADSAILPHFRTGLAVDNKQAASWDPVTEGDRAAERAIRAAIEQTYPTHGIIGEEYGEKKGSSAFTWVLDPIDGTRSFVIGLPTWATLIGLYRDGKPLLGVMHQPFIAETFYGSAEASFVKNRLGTTRLKVAPPKPLAQARAGTTTVGRFSNEAGFLALRKNVQLMRHDGDAYFFALLAAGQLDIALDGKLQIYDIAALIPIIAGAGGIVGAWDGGDPTQGGNVLTASCQSLFDEAKALLNSGA